MSPPPYGDQNRWEVRTRDLAVSFSIFDQLENLFNGHVAICNALTTGKHDPTPYEKSPLTSLGDVENARMRAEQLSSAEVQHLITNEIFPSGLRVMPEGWGSTEEEQVQAVAQATLQGLKALLPDIEISAETLEEVARDYLQTIAPGPDEGLEDLRRNL